MGLVGRRQRVVRHQYTLTKEALKLQVTVIEPGICEVITTGVYQGKGYDEFRTYVDENSARKAIGQKFGFGNWRTYRLSPLF